MKMVPSLMLRPTGVLRLRRNPVMVSQLHNLALVFLTNNGTCTTLVLEMSMFGRTKPPRNASNFQVMEILSLTSAMLTLNSNGQCMHLVPVLGLPPKVLGSTVNAIVLDPSLGLPDKKLFTKLMLLNTSKQALPLPLRSPSISLAFKLLLKLAMPSLINSRWPCQIPLPRTLSANTTQVPVLLSLLVAFGKLWWPPPTIKTTLSWHSHQASLAAPRATLNLSVLPWNSVPTLLAPLVRTLPEIDKAELIF